ncbi:MAG: exopolysaccharide biosynthesis polyprenyl glycosylphosphotransferase [bacterium]
MSSQRTYLQRQVVWLGVLDVLCLIVSLVAGIMIRMGTGSFGEYLAVYVSGWVYFVIAVLVANYVSGSYGLELRLSRFNMLINLAFSVVVAILVVSITSYAWLDVVLGRGVLLLTIFFYACLWGGLRLLIYQYFFRQDALAYRVAILGTGPRARSDLAQITDVNLRPKHNVAALIQVDTWTHPSQGFHGESLASHPPILPCTSGNLAATVKSLDVDVLLLAVENEEDLAGLYPQLRRLKFTGVAVMTPLNIAEIYSGRVPLNLVEARWLMHASQGFVSTMTLRMKRMGDTFLVLLVSPLVLVLSGVIALVIKCTEWGSPVIYSQQRVGRFGEVFLIHKFRTMIMQAEQDQGAVWSPENDPRVTPVGRVLRKFRLDEIPQLWNILKGEMSLVGPRPERPEIVDRLEKVIPYYRERENIPPGLSGWAQIRYPYGATLEDARAKLEYDLYYVQNFSISLDLRIILRTLRIVLFGMERDVK